MKIHILSQTLQKSYYGTIARSSLIAAYVLGLQMIVDASSLSQQVIAPAIADFRSRGG